MKLFSLSTINITSLQKQNKIAPTTLSTTRSPTKRPTIRPTTSAPTPAPVSTFAPTPSHVPGQTLAPTVSPGQHSNSTDGDNANKQGNGVTHTGNQATITLLIAMLIVLLLLIGLFVCGFCLCHYKVVMPAFNGLAKNANGLITAVAISMPVDGSYQPPQDNKAQNENPLLPSPPPPPPSDANHVSLELAEADEGKDNKANLLASEALTYEGDAGPQRLLGLQHVNAEHNPPPQSKNENNLPLLAESKKLTGDGNEALPTVEALDIIDLHLAAKADVEGNQNFVNNCKRLFQVANPFAMKSKMQEVLIVTVLGYLLLFSRKMIII
ncbi:hypothetical protein RFI_23225 [Reticulomyxa filosa]|uniref:Uncharacterized protein n=1 Tax=Reticulomyxa filosa TaxID=46433 RepID=X6ML09_RETFI|nr:hypothetical protein RFI_23225 [Reticulomyxa filosa]|eukprot:ETO14142.1 hypothetical protein RFI_23225 [Reticulomyxa filosa]